MSSEQLDPSIPPPPLPFPSSPAAIRRDKRRKRRGANGIFNTTNPANVTDQPSTDAFLGSAYSTTVHGFVF